MSDIYDGSDGQPMPIHNDGPSMHDLVREDLLERKAFGLRKYGTTLQAHNGRDPLKDLYDELLDAVVYTRQLIAERSFKASQSSTEGFSEVSHIPMMEEYLRRKWRVGSKLGRTIYAVYDTPGPDNCDVVLGMVDSKELADHIVEIHNIWNGFDIDD